MTVASYESNTNQFAAAINDITGGLSQWRLWTALASEDIRARFKRTYIGVLWTSLSFAVFISVKVWIFGSFSNQDVSYFAPYVAIGFFVWSFIAANVADGSAIFSSAENWIKGSRLPMTTYIMQSITRTSYLALYNFVVVAGVLIYFKVPLTWTALWCLPATILFIINAFWVHVIFGVISARFHDVRHLVQTIMRVMFFLTPIIWIPTELGRHGAFVIYNPFTHFVAVFREPLLDGTVAPLSWIVVLAITLCGSVAAFITLSFARRRVVFWL